MIGHITGTVVGSGPTYTIVSVGGLGYKVFAIQQTLSHAKTSGSIEFWTHLAVRETALDLYGFETEEELRFFELLLTVSGIGPKSALGILDVATVETLRSAISGGNASYLTKVSGIGRKTAEKIVLELKDKVGIAREGSARIIGGDEEALEALKTLGYSGTEARDVLRRVSADIVGSSERLREALKILGGK